MISIFYAANTYFFLKFFSKGQEVGLPPNHIFFQFLHEQQRIMDIIFLVTAGFAFIFLFSVGFIISNKVSGSMHRMQIHLRQMKQSQKFIPIKFRKGDYFQEVAESLNDFAKDAFKKD
jgi:hypothetical protein